MTLREMNPSLDRRSFLAGLSLVTAASLAGNLIPMQAFATSWSPAISKSKNGVTFTYQSGIDTIGKVVATTKITASKTVAKDTMKAQAVIVKDLNNNIITTSKIKSNEKGRSLVVTATLSSLAAGYRSKGRVWHSGSGWKTAVLPTCPAPFRPSFP